MAGGADIMVLSRRQLEMLIEALEVGVRRGLVHPPLSAPGITGNVTGAEASIRRLLDAAR